MKKLVIGITIIALSTPYFYDNYKEYKDKLPLLANTRLYQDERTSTTMKRVSYDPGHGPKTPGKKAPDNTPEWKANRKVADYFAIELKRNGIAGYDVTEGEQQEDIALTTRTKRANSWKSDVHISFHHNAMNAVPKWQTTTRGIETWYVSQKGMKLAKSVQNAAIQETKQINRGYMDAKSKRWTILIATNMPAIIFECGFEDNKTDYQLIYKSKDDWYPKACARAACMGICDYFGIKYISGGSDEVSSSTSYNIVDEIKAFQKENELTVDGIIGPKTWEALMFYRDDWVRIQNGLDKLQEDLVNVMGDEINDRV